MTGKEFLEKKIKEIAENLSDSKYKIDIKFYDLSTGRSGTANFTDNYNYYDWVDFSPIRGADIAEYEERLKKYPHDAKTVTLTKNFCRRLNDATAMLRFYYSKDFTIKDLREIFHLSKEETTKPVEQKISEIEGYPEEVSGKGAIRIKIETDAVYYGHPVYRIVILGKPSKDKKHFTITAPSQIAVQHSAELTFLKKEDAEKFIADNQEFFSRYEGEEIKFSKAQTHDYVRVPVMGSTVTYVNKDYIKWRDREGKFSPKFS